MISALEAEARQRAEGLEAGLRTNSLELQVCLPPSSDVRAGAVRHGCDACSHAPAHTRTVDEAACSAVAQRHSVLRTTRCVL